MNKLAFGMMLLTPFFTVADVSQEAFLSAAQEIVEVGHFLNELNLCSATAGNFSKRVDSDLIAVTVSGKHKGELTVEDVILVDLKGNVIDSLKKPSAETIFHTLVYQWIPSAGAVLHTHSVNGTVLSIALWDEDAIVTEGYEIHKALGFSTHESTVEIPIFENSQDYVTLGAEVSDYLEEHPESIGFFLRGHGLYTWGKDLKEAKIRTEAFEFLFACELKLRSL